MARKTAYQRKTGYTPHSERVLFVDATHRPSPDLGRLSEVFIRLALQRVGEARTERESTALPAELKPGTPG